MKLEDLDRDVAVALFAFGAGASPCGSRVTCSPAPMHTDRDFLVEVLPESSEGLATALWDLHFVREGDVTYFHDAKGDGFASYRRGDLNLIVTSDAKFAERHRAATHVCTRLNLMHKPDRIALFQAVLYGKKWND